MEGVAVPKTGLKNALLRDNLYMMGAACFPCAREHTQGTLTGGNGITIARVPCAREQTPVDAFDLGALASRINCALAITPLSVIRCPVRHSVPAGVFQGIVFNTTGIHCR